MYIIVHSKISILFCFNYSLYAYYINLFLALSPYLFMNQIFWSQSKSILNGVYCDGSGLIRGSGENLPLDRSATLH